MGALSLGMKTIDYHHSDLTATAGLSAAPSSAGGKGSHQSTRVGVGGKELGQGEDRRQHAGQGVRAAANGTLSGAAHLCSHLCSLRGAHVLVSVEPQ